MRLLFLILCSVLSSQAFGQDVDSPDAPVDCEVLTLKTINKLTDNFKLHRLDSFDVNARDWIKHCGVSECTQRIIILKQLLAKEETDAAIRVYIENYFHEKLRARIHYGKQVNFGYVYSSSKSYFDFVPLRHPIDSITSEESNKLLDSQTLNPDEKLICLLFAGRTEEFDTEIKKSEYDQGFIKTYLYDEYRKRCDQGLAFTVYSGVYKPLRKNDVFSNSPMIGFSFSSPKAMKLMVELGFKFRFNVNDEAFDYYALGDTNRVNSDYSIFFGGYLGYKMYESKKLVLIPKLGMGLESVETGLSEKKENSEEVDYLNIDIFHFSLGLSAMTPVNRKGYFGLGINYHYCPYDSDENLYTKFENNLISAEVFYRF
jgi:hypothetical protein